jgi:hypothetical protein
LSREDDFPRARVTLAELSANVEPRRREPQSRRSLELLRLHNRIARLQVSPIHHHKQLNVQVPEYHPSVIMTFQYSNPLPFVNSPFCGHGRFDRAMKF